MDLSIEELGELRVTSVSRRPESSNNAAAALYVITGDEIRRSGARSLPEALRLAPDLEVVRDNAHNWTISIRGFNRDLSNKLLVLIDGRSVYSPLYAGVFWDVQDTLLEDIDRIEIISGPGGTLWGANAVNGVVNVITRSAWETQGTALRATLGSGTEENQAASVRYGARLAENVAARAYVKYFDRDGSVTADGGDAFDDWQMARSGFRLDFDPHVASRFTLQGDVYSGKQSSLVRGDFTLGTLPGPESPGTIDVGGYNLLGRWERTQSDSSTLQLQTYLDRTERDIPGSFGEDRDTFDVDFQHSLVARERHNIVWGLGYRVTEDALRNTLFSSFEPPMRTDRTQSAFVQDEIEIAPGRFHLILGTKWQRNDYSGDEQQPNVRFSWRLDERQMVWGAVSEAVRIPARLEEDIQLNAPFAIPGVDVPFYAQVRGNDAFEPEELLAREIGYRLQARPNLAFDFALYHHDYDRLFTNETREAVLVEGPPAYIVLPIDVGNGMEGEVYGGRFVTTWQPLSNWRLEFQYARLEMDLRSRPGSNDTNSLGVAGNSPENKFAVYSWLDLPANLSLFTGVRYTDELPGFGVSTDTDVDASLDWQPADGWRLSFTLRNLTDERNFENAGGSAIERSAYLQIERTY
jgi:iron complex outermembrane receptor protein